GCPYPQRRLQDRAVASEQDDGRTGLADHLAQREADGACTDDDSGHSRSQRNTVQRVYRAGIDVGKGRLLEPSLGGERMQMANVGHVELGKARAHAARRPGRTIDADVSGAALACRTSAAAGELHGLDGDVLPNLESVARRSQGADAPGDLVPPGAGKAGRAAPGIMAAVS